MRAGDDGLARPYIEDRRMTQQQSEPGTMAISINSLNLIGHHLSPSPFPTDNRCHEVRSLVTQLLCGMQKMVAAMMMTNTSSCLTSCHTPGFVVNINITWG